MLQLPWASVTALAEKIVFAAPVIWFPDTVTLAFATGVMVPAIVTLTLIVTAVTIPGSAGNVGLTVVFVVRAGTATAGGL